MSKHITVRLLKTKDTKILKAAKKKWHITYKGALIWMALDLSSEHKGQKEVAHFSSAKSKEMSTMNSIAFRN